MLKNNIIISFLILILIIMITVIYFYLPIKQLIIYNKSYEYNTINKATPPTLEIIHEMIYNIENGLTDTCRTGNYALNQGYMKQPTKFLCSIGILKDICDTDDSLNPYCDNSPSQQLTTKKSKILFSHFNKLNSIKNYMVSNSDNFKKSSCEILNTDTFNKAYQYINDIIYIILNHMFIHGPFQINEYLNLTYDNYSLLYRYINKNNILKISNIDTVLITNHHQAVEWIYRKFPGDTIPAIFHVDTHADDTPFFMNGNEDLYKYKKGIIENNNDIIDDFYNKVLNNDIGCVLVPSIYPYDNNNGVLWLCSDWTHPNAKLKNKIYNSFKSNNSSVHQENPHSMNSFKTEGEGDFIVGYNFFNHNVIEDDSKTLHMSTVYLNEIDNYLLESFPNNYILNIDLDYFVTYGGSSYSNIEDPTSFNRTTIDFKRALRDVLYEEYVAKQLSYEINIIRKRIDDFLLLIKKLKDNGKIPSFIIICNSTSVNKSNIQFLEPWENNNIYKEKIGLIDSDNDYTPKYLTLWLQNTLINHLYDIF